MYTRNKRQLFFSTFSPEEFLVLLWLGRFVTEKGAHLAIEAEKGVLFQGYKL
jgi:glycosyltransferase involved in cell wall biosynthesis